MKSLHTEVVGGRGGGGAHYITVLRFTSLYNSFSTCHATGKQTLLGILILELLDLIIQNYTLCFFFLFFFIFYFLFFFI